jgi:acyl-CoA reductase-like NAD-dependent aldehyde dehydrogenase
VLNIVPGLGAHAGKALASSPRIRKLDLTGGTATGRVAAAAAGHNLVSTVAELGGKAPVIVFEDADLEQAVNGAAFASFIAAGQTCIMGARLLVHESVYERVVGRLVDKVRDLRLGDSMDPETQMGPVISPSQLSRVEALVATAPGEGAKILCGGRRPDHLPSPLSRGNFFLPTVIGGVRPGMRVVEEEIFGPVVVCYSFRDEREAVTLANQSRFGLAAAVWTNNIKRGHRVAQELDVGIVWVNDHHRNDPASPWGGTKDSGMGRENGLEAFREYTQTRSVVVNTSDQPFDWFVKETVRYS